MKKIFLLTLLSCLSLAGHTQNLGNKFITGSLHYSSLTSDMPSGLSSPFVEKVTRFTIAPKAGFFVKPQWAVGFGVAFSYEEEKLHPQHYRFSNNQRYTTKETNTLGLELFTRYYVPLGDKAAFFAQATGRYTTGSATTDFEGNPTTETTVNGWHGYATPGLVFFPGTKIGIEFTLGEVGYRYQNSESVKAPMFSTQTKGFTSRLGLDSFSVGVSLYMGRTPAE